MFTCISFLGGATLSDSEAAGRKNEVFRGCKLDSDAMLAQSYRLLYGPPAHFLTLSSFLASHRTTPPALLIYSVGSWIAGMGAHALMSDPAVGIVFTRTSAGLLQGHLRSDLQSQKKIWS